MSLVPAGLSFDGADAFTIKDERYARWWTAQAFSVLLLIWKLNGFPPEHPRLSELLSRKVNSSRANAPERDCVRSTSRSRGEGDSRADVLRLVFDITALRKMRIAVSLPPLQDACY